MAAQANIKAVITADDRASATLNSFGNSVSNLGSKITSTIQIAAVAAFAALTTAVVTASKASWDQVDAIQQATVGLKAYEKDGNKVNQVLSDLVKYARSDLGVLFNRKDLFQSAQSLKLMGDNTENLVDHVKILSRSVGLGLSTWEELNLIVGRVGSTGQLTGIDFDNLTKAGFKLDNSLRNSGVTFEELFKQLDKGIPADALAGQAETIQGKFIRLETAFRGVGDAILDVNSETGQFNPGGLGDKITIAVTKITEFLKNPEFKAGVSKIASYVVKAIDKVVEILNRPEVQQAFKDTLAGIKEGFNLFKIALKGAFDYLKPVFDYIKNNKEAWEVLKISLIVIVALIIGLTIAVGIGLVGAFAALMAVINIAVAVVTAIVLAILWLGDAIAGVIWWLMQLRDGWNEFLKGLILNVASGINVVINFFKNLPGNILSAVGNLGNILFNIGRNIVEGLINGVNSMIGQAVGAVNNIAGSIVKNIKNVLGIKSPSKVFAGIGENIGLGMIQGIESTMPGVAGAMDGLVPNVTSTNSALSSQGGTVVRQTSQTPNITIQVGAFMGTQTDARKLAKMVFESYSDLKAMGNA